MISLLVPSRGRPANLAHLYSSVRATAADPWEMVVRLDEDDPERDFYPELAGVRYLVGPRGILSAMWDECLTGAEGPVFGQLGDDVVFRTPGWDRMVAEAFPPDGIAFVHGDDLGGKGDSLGTHGFVRHEWTDAVGFVPPHFSADYGDLWLNEVADALGRRVFLPGLVMEHMHPGFGKAEPDRTYEETWARGRRDDVDRTWRETVGERESAVRTLRGAIARAVWRTGALSQ